MVSGTIAIIYVKLIESSCRCQCASCVKSSCVDGFLPQGGIQYCNVTGPNGLMLCGYLNTTGWYSTLHNIHDVDSLWNNTGHITTVNKLLCHPVWMWFGMDVLRPVYGWILGKELGHLLTSYALKLGHLSFVLMFPVLMPICLRTL